MDEQEQARPTAEKVAAARGADGQTALRVVIREAVDWYCRDSIEADESERERLTGHLLQSLEPFLPRLPAKDADALAPPEPGTLAYRVLAAISFNGLTVQSARTIVEEVRALAEERDALWDTQWFSKPSGGAAGVTFREALFARPGGRSAYEVATTERAVREQAERERDQACEAIRWALGEEGEFDPPREAKQYWWRGTLRRLSGLVFSREHGRSVRPEEAPVAS